MRAAFLAVDNHKQVAVLVPTTLLAQQHYDNFRDRFANWPVRIEMISRFRSAKEQTQILADVAEGKFDILIGTHNLLLSDVKFKDLGLLIVDEEHRFGVRHKERIKAMRANVDILTLTATPIPRTLNMAMSGMRDLSIIATPPARRLAVKTFVREYDSLVVREAILREILRGGQVYYPLLAQQHYDNFRDRFANWPVRIEMISRFRSAKEQTQILADVAEGKIDILIGTHKLLHSDVKFKDLGPLIVDEEHRYGVRHKESIKAMRANVDILTLTATPIPRTLNMAMSGMRDLSIIATPPARRLAVKTFVREYDSLVVREAILREILRGGQVYYLYNDVENIQKAAERLAELVPEARIAIGHGQMRERELERVMNDFHHQRFNVLVCTTIIETGIDIPTANTIIIERADHFGLAQLHQLRGRVGRSHHQAYAWLLTPHPKAMTTDAQKRLEAIASLEDLGAGFALATHDLEIRGAGELLGEEQSGSMETIGFSLYMELLENAVDALKAGREPSLEDLTSQQTEVELRMPSLLPDDFIPDVNTRLSFYKRIASAKTENELEEIKVELIDRFGLLPDPARTLLDIARLRQQAQKLGGIRKLEGNEKGGVIEFAEKNHVNPAWLIGLLQKQPQHYRLDGPTRLKFIQDLSERKTRIEWVRQFMRELEENAIA